MSNNLENDSFHKNEQDFTLGDYVLEPIVWIFVDDDNNTHEKTDEEISLHSEKNQRMYLQLVHQVLFGSIMKKFLMIMIIV